MRGVTVGRWHPGSEGSTPQFLCSHKCSRTPVRRSETLPQPSHWKWRAGPKFRDADWARRREASLRPRSLPELGWRKMSYAQSHVIISEEWVQSSFLKKVLYTWDRVTERRGDRERTRQREGRGEISHLLVHISQWPQWIPSRSPTREAGVPPRK